MASAAIKQAAFLLSAGRNHPDESVRASSLHQMRDVLLSAEPSVVAELVPSILELQSSREPSVRKFLAELIEDFGLRVMERSPSIASVLVTLLNDPNPTVVQESISSGTRLFCIVLEEVALQFLRSGTVDWWLHDLWLRMLKLKDAICCILSQLRPAGTKFLAIKFIEVLIVLLTPDPNDSESTSSTQTPEGKFCNFSMSWIEGGHPILEKSFLIKEAGVQLGALLEHLQSTLHARSAVTITLVNCLAAVARKRPQYYNQILSAMINVHSNADSVNGRHVASIQHAVKTAFLSFLKIHNTNSSMFASRDRLRELLHELNAGEAADQILRQIEKITRYNERAVRDTQHMKDDEQLPGQQQGSWDFSRKRLYDNGKDEDIIKRSRLNPVSASGQPVPSAQIAIDNGSTEGVNAKTSLLDSDMAPVDQMIAVIGALLAEGERGASSLEILISNTHSDVLADIVMANMRNLPKSLGSLSHKSAFVSQVAQSSLPSVHVPASTVSSVPVQQHGFTLQIMSSSSSSLTLSSSDVPPSIPADKRDPRRDPRRLDPRRATAHVATELASSRGEDAGDSAVASDGPGLNDKSSTLPLVTNLEDATVSSMSKSDIEASGSHVLPIASPVMLERNIDDMAEVLASTTQIVLSENPLEEVLPPAQVAEKEHLQSASLENTIELDGADSSDSLDSEQQPLSVNGATSDDVAKELPPIPVFVELNEEVQTAERKSAFTRLLDSYSQIHAAGCNHTRTALLASLVTQSDEDGELLEMLEKHVIENYHHEQGHELSMHLLYHLQTVNVAKSGDSSFEMVYEKFFLFVAKFLRDKFPASDKSLSKFFSEAPFLPPSALQLLEELCHPDENGKYNADRITQGLGALWSLILGRPLMRKSCLDVVLKCTIHVNDEVRAKAIRLIANKLYHLTYVSETIERFATDMLLSVVDGHGSHGSFPSDGEDGRPLADLESKEPPTAPTEPNNPENGSNYDEKKMPNHLIVTLSQAQRYMSLFFALCAKKHRLLQLVFTIYGRAPKTVKQAVHRHMPILIRGMGSSYSELLGIISDPPEGSDNLLILILQILAEESTPPPRLVTTVKRLYETKLKDAAILIPMLSSFSKEEVLPLFPRLIGLPLDKFQAALARILQGSAHTGPALTPAEVLIAIHGVDPVKDKIQLKKITEACSACFEQRTVFTQQVLARVLNQLVEQTPLPLLLMRTIIQAIDAFPVLVDCVMGILSRLIVKQIWKMPKLWVGFLKCAFQTQPHSFPVLLQLPASQLENALNRHPLLKAPLAGYANQTSIRTSLPRSVLVILGIVAETSLPLAPQAYSHPPDTCSSIQSSSPT